MSKELDEKWLELVAAGRAEWMPGMSTDGMTVVDADETGISIVRKETIQDHWAPKDAVPDWNDPATLGCLLGQVRKRWDDPAAHAVPGWVAAAGLWWGQYGTGDTEAEALLAALEAAP
jgi:hypothetical protein